MSTAVLIETDKSELVETLKDGGFKNVHATNGVYDMPVSVMRGTTLAAFQYVVDQHPKTKNLLIAINSDSSLKRFAAKKARETGKPPVKYESMRERTEKVLSVLSGQFKKQNTAIVFYNEDTPHELYKAMHEGGIKIATLHKWGYGTSADAPSIVGAEFAQQVYGFPLPAQTAHMKPAYWDFTPKDGNKSVKVVDLARTPRLDGKGFYLNN